MLPSHSIHIISSYPIKFQMFIFAIICLDFTTELLLLLLDHMIQISFGLLLV